MEGKVLIIGAGRVSGPCVKFLSEKGYHITVGSPIQSELDLMKESFPSINPCIVDVKDKPKLELLVQQHDIVVSLAPAHLNPELADVCISHGKHFVNASFVCEDMQLLHERARRAGLALLSEAGLDPGIDHAIAMNIIDSIRRKQGQVTSFTSMCGGIPAPQYSHCPLRYKCSWYPKGMLISVMKPSKYCNENQLINIDAGHNYDNPVPIPGLVENEMLEVVPNRDSLGYRDLYGIQSAQSIFRGTLRYQGFSKAMKTLIQLGFLSDKEHGEDCKNLTWMSYFCKALGIPSNSSLEEVKKELFEQAGQDWTTVEDIIKLGLCDDKLMPNLATPMDDLAALLTERLSYGPQERDMVVMRTVVEASYPEDKKERYTVDLVDIGQVNGYSSMSRTVGIPVGVCTHLLLQGAVKETGVIIPIHEAIYKPLLETLAHENIILKTAVQVIDK